ncbi:MAG: NADH-quinone oxidoreductase subunit NuoK [Alphaproteobacteria bacterium]|jgi:NADH-quinone oxidoreductase subunit K|nr:NADH-quinone oxidoreductase subunit NuoK [Alphaproteobacteria bacterium]
MFEITLNHYLIVAALVFSIGGAGLLVGRRNLIALLMSIELMLLGVNINMVAFSAYLKDLVGQLFTLFILTIAAAEAAIGLAILVVYQRQRQTIDVDDVSRMKG